MDLRIRDFQLGEMLDLTGKLLSEEVKPTVKVVTEVDGLRPQMEKVHADLLDARGTMPEEQREYDQLTLAATDFDDQHDHLGRAGFYGLKAALAYRLAQRPVDVEAVAAVEEVLDTLYPDDLSMTKRSYAEEAGNAVQMAEAAKKLESTLRTVKVDNGVAMTAVMAELGAVGAHLSQAERKRKDAVAAVEKATLTRSQIRARMRAWAEVMEAVVKNLRISNAPDDQVQALFRHIQAAAEKAAARRRARRNKKNKPEEQQ